MKISVSNRDFHEIIFKKSTDSSQILSGDNLIFSSYSDVISNFTLNDFDSENKKDQSISINKEKIVKDDSYLLENNSKLSWSFSYEK